MSAVEIDFSEMYAFINKIDKAANGGLKKEFAKFLQGLGDEFLRILQDEIQRRKVMNSRLLLASFHKGDSENVWELNEGELTLEVGSTLDYASYANDGHFQKPGRFIPGYWKKKNGDDVFEYDPSAKGGMVLKAEWVEGKPYWDSALRILDKMLPNFLDAKMQAWLDDYFG